MNDAKQDLYPQQELGFRTAEFTLEDERLHAAADENDASSSETSYFGFNIPEHAINGEIYHWFHPTSRLCTGGVWIWQGKKRDMLQADYFNYQAFNRTPELDLDDWVSPIGVRQKVLEPGKALTVEFSDDREQTKFSLTQTAIMPPAVRTDDKHFTQAMRVSGELTLRGERYDVDGYFTRDRSWQQLRPETAHPIPPLTWCAGVFGDDLAFHFTGFDDPELGPDWVDAYSADVVGTPLRWGYTYRDGQTFPLTALRKITRRDTDGISPESADIEIEDAGGQTLRMTAACKARIPGPSWFNMQVYFCQMEFQLADGRVGYGDFQDCQFPAYVRRHCRL